MCAENFGPPQLSLFEKLIVRKKNQTLATFTLLGAEGTNLQRSVNRALATTVTAKFTQQEHELFNLKSQLENNNQEIVQLKTQIDRFFRVMSQEERLNWLRYKFKLHCLEQTKSLSSIVAAWLKEESNNSTQRAFAKLRKIVEAYSKLQRTRKEAVTCFLTSKEQYAMLISTVDDLEKQLKSLCFDEQMTSDINAAQKTLEIKKELAGKLNAFQTTIGQYSNTSMDSVPSATVDLKAIGESLLQVNSWVGLVEKICESGIEDTALLIGGSNRVTELWEMVRGVISWEKKYERKEQLLKAFEERYQQARKEVEYTEEQRQNSSMMIEELSRLEKEFEASELVCIDAEYCLKKAIKMKLSEIGRLTTDYENAVQAQIQKKRAVYNCRSRIRELASLTLPKLLLQNSELKLQITELGGELDQNESLSDYTIVETNELLPANVTKRKLIGSNEIYAFKRLPNSQGTKIDNEIRPLKRLKHEHIGELLNVMVSSDDIYLKMPYYSEGSLESWLRKNRIGAEKEKKEIYCQILKGLEFIHSQNVIHLDMKPSNVVLQRYGNRLNARIIDFGISKDLTRTMTTSSFAGGTRGYVAPEVEKGQKVGAGADLWSFGVMLWEAFLNTPFMCKPDGTVEIPSKCDLKLRSLLQQLLQKDPRDRRSASYHLINSEFFSSQSPMSDNLQIYVQQVRNTIDRSKGQGILQLRVSRDTLVADALSFFSNKCYGNTMWQRLEVRFDQEFAIDLGGPRREFYSRFFSKVVEPGGYFEGDDSSFMPLKDDDLPEGFDCTIFESIGKVMGKAIVDGDVAGVYFAKPLFKALLGEELSLSVEDLSDYSPQMARTVLMVEHSTEEELEELGLGVTLSNRKLFVVNQCLDVVRTRKIACDALKRGFELFLNPLKKALLGNGLQHTLSADVLHALLVGSTQLDAETMVPHLKFDDRWQGRETPTLLREWLHTLNTQELKNFWRFCTGSTAFRIDSWVDVKIQIRPDGNVNALPEAHTCAKELVIPDYGNAELLAEKMKHTLVEVEFGFV